MNSPRPWSYHQNAIAVPTSSASSAFATRLRSSVRCAISDIVACASRGGRRRRRRVASVTVVRLERAGSAGAVGRAAPLGLGAELGGARLGDPRLLLEARRQVTGGRRGCGGDDLAADGGLGGVLRADVVVLHALHLALEDAQRATQPPGGIGQLLVAAEDQQGDHEDDQQRRYAESGHDVSSWCARAPAILLGSG